MVSDITRTSKRDCPVCQSCWWDALMGADADAQCNTDDGQRSSTAAVLAGRATTLPETAAGRDEPSGPRPRRLAPAGTAGDKLVERPAVLQLPHAIPGAFTGAFRAGRNMLWTGHGQVQRFFPPALTTPGRVG